MATIAAVRAAVFSRYPGGAATEPKWRLEPRLSEMGTSMLTRDVEMLWDELSSERFRLTDLTKDQRDTLEDDLQLVVEVQRGLLPQRDFACGGWQTSYYYEPAGLVSGDYCDVVDAGPAGLYFMVGDVCGKGVAASFLMAHLHATFRTLISMALPIKVMLERASRVLCETTLPMHYATLVCGRAKANGMVEICNSGHPLPLMVDKRGVTALMESGRPFGMFPDEEFSITEVSMKPGESLVLYSDGVSEATDIFGDEYGATRLRNVVRGGHEMHPSTLVAACRDDVLSFRRGAEQIDDVTIFVLGRDRLAGTMSLQ